ncbi:MAG: DNA2/NAM7 family helicase, partial [Prevotella sp.]|nr:DNA2/NAM7 family helicase [Prevotella sp.]
MQNLTKSLIILNGELKTLQIASISKLGASAFRVCFKNSPKSYTYSADKVIWLTKPQWLIPKLHKVFRGGRLQTDVAEIWQFEDGQNIYWRVKYHSGFEGEYADGQLNVVKTCLDDETSKNTFAYLKQVAAINPLRKENDKEGILSQVYNKVDFIDDKTAAACYINPSKHKVKKLFHKDLIYPFGCNASQKRAVAAAFEYQVSVVQGPPGTGKTQTILNIIANIVRNEKTVLVVSNNNSAITNVQEKLEKYGLAFIMAPLGSKENKALFLCQQTVIPTEVSSWPCSMWDGIKTLHDTLKSLDKVYVLQNEDAILRQEQQNVDLEWKHFCMDNGIDEHTPLERRTRSSLIISLWLHYQSKAAGTLIVPNGLWSKMIEGLKSLWIHIVCRYRLRLRNRYDQADMKLLIIELQTLYYLNRRAEIEERLSTIKQELSTYNADLLTKTLTDTSMTLLKASLHSRYDKKESIFFQDTKDMKTHGKEFLKRYPVVLSTTFSARSCLFGDTPYDYIIMDEASQVSVETGALALTCAKNAVIVGDTLQLSNVVTAEDRAKLTAIMEQHHIPKGYDCAKNSFLESIRTVIKNVPETMLREHYRCHPRIINFCNQKFYGGNLLIMTRDHGEEDVLCAYFTRKGNHATGQYNQREIDVVREEVLPSLTGYEDIGIVTPYKNQVNQFHCQMEELDAATIHKFQGREKDAIIMSVVDNQITPFADDANLLNVAVSRAKKKLCLVMTGNEQERHGNIMDLLDYIHYNNCTVTDSKISSIFDYLYEQYTAERMAMLEHLPHISEYA